MGNKFWPKKKKEIATKNGYPGPWLLPQWGIHSLNKGFESAATGYDDKLLIYVIHNNNLLTDLLRLDISAEMLSEQESKEVEKALLEES